MQMQQFLCIYDMELLCSFKEFYWIRLPRGQFASFLCLGEDMRLLQIYDLMIGF